MIKIERSRYPQFIPQAAASPCNRVYPCSIAEGRQAGDIFVSEGGDPAVLFWHRCGFGYLSGAATERFLEEILYEESLPGSGLNTPGNAWKRGFPRLRASCSSPSTRSS